MDNSLDARLCAIERALNTLIKLNINKESATSTDDVLDEIKQLNQRLLVPPKDHLDFKEAMRYLGISKSTLYKMNCRNAIPYSKGDGIKVYYQRADLDSYISKNKIASTEQINQKVKRYIRD